LNGILSDGYSMGIYATTGVIGFGGLESFFVGGGTLGPTLLETGGGTGFFCCSTTGYLNC
jgi:hypothetical protein